MARSPPLKHLGLQYMMSLALTFHRCLSADLNLIIGDDTMRFPGHAAYVEENIMYSTVLLILFETRHVGPPLVGKLPSSAGAQHYHLLPIRLE